MTASEGSRGYPPEREAVDIRLGERQEEDGVIRGPERMRTQRGGEATDQWLGGPQWHPPLGNR
jgi:hypothetical protein